MSLVSTTGATDTEASAWVPGMDEAAWEVVLGACAGEAERKDRQAAFERYRQAVLPHGKMEEWRRTDPARIPFASMKYLPRLVPGDCREHEWDGDFDVVARVEDDRFQVVRNNRSLDENALRVLPLPEALSRGYAREEELAAWGARPDYPDKFSIAAESFWNVGVFIEVGAGVDVPRGVLIRCHRATSGRLLMPRVVFRAGERSRVAVLEVHTASEGAEVLTAPSKRLLVGSGAQAGWCTLRDESERTVHLADEWASLARDARLDWVTLNLGGRLVKARFTSDAREAGASAELAGLFLAGGEQHVDQKTLQVHSAPDTFSRLLYKGAVKDHAYSVYQGQIIARPGAVRVDAYQRNNNLVLNDGARADSMPGLQIDADDLKCSHGSTIGNLDEEQVFYLRSRGVEDRSARALLIEGFFEEIIQRIPHERLREVLQRRVRERIA
jgi:Fe-S cluster assembly protein SufD